MNFPRSVAIVHVSNHTSRVPDGKILEAKKAVQRQINEQAARHWPTPHIIFGYPYTYHVHLYEGQAPGGEGGFNSERSCAVGTGTPENGFMVKGKGGRSAPWTVVLSHELLEMLSGKQIADAVEANHYKLDGVMVSNFVLPSWYKKEGEHPFDHLRMLIHPGQVAPGGYT